MSVQEKFQTIVPFSKIKSEEGKSGKWVSMGSQRAHLDLIPKTDFDSNGFAKPDRFKEMPQNMQIDPKLSAYKFHLGFGGDTDVSDNINEKSLEKGFSRQDMSPTDEVYTGEQVDLFYSEVVEDGGKDVGFSERNNYLDRL